MTLDIFHVCDACSAMLISRTQDRFLYRHVCILEDVSADIISESDSFSSNSSGKKWDKKYIYIYIHIYVNIHLSVDFLFFH